MPVSQEISSPGNIVAAAKVPRIYGRSNITERPYFLENIAAPRKSVAGKLYEQASDDDTGTA